jgi:hypothetical protein
MQAYQDALSGPSTPVGAGRHKPGTLGALAAEFIRSAEFANLKPSSQATYRFALDPVLKRDGHRLVRDLPADKARKILQEIGESRPGMANLTRAVLRRLFAFAMDTGLRRDNSLQPRAQIQVGHASHMEGRRA